eukprot:gene17774-21241_t
MHSRNAEVIDLATLIDRSPSSVARKLGNFASFDPKLKERGVRGLENVSKLDKQIWEDYMYNWDEQFIESEKLLAKRKLTTIEQLNYIALDNLTDIEGKEKERVTLVLQELLVASHILPWSEDKGNRLNPKNGLAFNPLHDKAFDCGLLTITPELKIKISSYFLKNRDVLSIKHNFIDFDGQSIIEPQKFFPDAEFLKVHN